MRGQAFAEIPEYRRHVFTETGVSPLGVPGDSRHVVVTDSDEHDEEGHIVEDAETRKRMMDKRLLKKLPLIKGEIAPPVLYGSEKPEIVLAGWGSNYGLMKEAVDSLSQNRNIAMLHFSEIFPLPLTTGLDYLDILRHASLSICLENNATGQFARLLKSETGYTFNRMLNRFDGRPYMIEELIGEINGLFGRL